MISSIRLATRKTRAEINIVAVKYSAIFHMFVSFNKSLKITIKLPRMNSTAFSLFILYWGCERGRGWLRTEAVTLVRGVAEEEGSRIVGIGRLWRLKRRQSCHWRLLCRLLCGRATPLCEENLNWSDLGFTGDQTHLNHLAPRQKASLSRGTIRNQMESAVKFSEEHLYPSSLPASFCRSKGTFSTASSRFPSQHSGTRR